MVRHLLGDARLDQCSLVSWALGEGDPARAFAEGDLAVLPCYRHWPGGHDYADLDIFRFDNTAKIAEHWDVLRVIPNTAENNNGMF